MKCPSCSSRIEIITNAKFMITLALRKAMMCPYCKANIYKQTNHTWEYFKLIIFSIFFIGFILFLLAIILSQQIGIKSALTICFWYWVVVIVVIFAIILLNLTLISFHKMYVIVRKEKKG